jgi:hypothetical protein
VRATSTILGAMNKSIAINAGFPRARDDDLARG